MISAANKPKVRAILRYARAEIQDDAKLMRILEFSCDQFDGPGDGKALCAALLKEVATQGVTEPTPPPPVQAADDFANISRWNGAARGSWPATVTISRPRVEGENIVWDELPGQRAARKWNVEGSGKKVDAETCLVVPAASVAGVFDFCGPSQTRKTFANLVFKSRAEPGMLAPWTPKKGDKVGLYLTTLNRQKSQHRLSERSNVAWFIWP